MGHLLQQGMPSTRSALQTNPNTDILFAKMMVWVATSADAIATALTYHQYQSSSFLPRAVCPHPSSSITDSYSPQTLDFQPPNPLFTPSPLLILGALAVFFGASLRLWCFHALGRLFTFEVTIHPTHTLVTSGPYAFVRHPSYTGVWLTLVGSTLVALAPGSWIPECWLSPSYQLFSISIPPHWLGRPETSEAIKLSFWGFSIMQILIFSLIAFWLVKITYALRSTHKRLHIEDVELHKVFGETWEAYARRVRWKLVPGIF